MAVVTIEKLMPYKGDLYIDLRDYFCREQMKRKQDIRVVHGDEYMDIPSNKIYRSKVIITKQSIKSIIYAGQEYKLWSYLWKPMGKVPKYTLENK